jgi:hypothetical protein
MQIIHGLHVRDVASHQPFGTNVVLLQLSARRLNVVEDLFESKK